MKRLAPVAAACVVAAGLTVAAAASSDESADAFIVDAMTAPASLSYAGTVEVVQIGDQHSEAAVYRIEHRPPNLTQRVYLSPPRLMGDEVLNRGDDAYFVDARLRRTVHTINESFNDQIALDGNYLLLRANYQAVKKTTESIAGRTVRDVSLVNKYTNRPTMLLQIDEQTKLILDKQQFAPSGALVSEFRFESVRYSPSIRDGDFDVPKAFAVVQGPHFSASSDDVPQVVQSAGFAARAPKILAEGFSSIEGRLLQRQGARTLHVLYSDGIRTVSLFQTDQAPGPDLTTLHPQNVNVAGHPAQYAERGAMTLLTWTDGTLRCTLVGELTLDELQRIAASVH